MKPMIHFDSGQLRPYGLVAESLDDNSNPSMPVSSSPLYVVL
jgi:hypothetical protein